MIVKHENRIRSLEAALVNKSASDDINNKNGNRTPVDE